jgi:hypothetical protein
MEASNQKVADLQEACKLRQLEVEALQKEREAEKRDCNRWMGELQTTRHQLAEKTFELQIAKDALQPFLDAREGLIDEAKKIRLQDSEFHVGGEEGVQARGMVKKLSSDVPLLGRALEREAKIRENLKRHVKDKQVVLMATINETRDKGVAICETWRNKLIKTRTMHAFCNVICFERQHNSLINSFSKKVDRRLLRIFLQRLMQQMVMRNLLRRRGYLSSRRHVRLLTLAFFSAWRWTHFSGRWLPMTQPSPSTHKSPTKLDLKKSTLSLLQTPLTPQPRADPHSKALAYGVHLEKSTPSTRHAIMTMTEHTLKNDMGKETDELLQSLVSTSTQMRQHEQQTRIGPWITTTRAFDPGNLAMARAKENFEIAAMAPRRMSSKMYASPGGGGGEVSHLHESSLLALPEEQSSLSDSLQQKHEASHTLQHKHAMQNSNTPQRTPLMAVSIDRTASMAVNISSDSESSLDSVLEEAERESVRWMDRRSSRGASGSQRKSARSPRQVFPYISPDSNKSSPAKTSSSQVEVDLLYQLHTSPQPRTQEEGEARLRRRLEAHDSPGQMEPSHATMEREATPPTREREATPPTPLSEREATPPTLAISPNNLPVRLRWQTREVLLAEKLKRFYERYVSDGAPHPEPARVAEMYVDEEHSLNQALLAKYGKISPFPSCPLPPSHSLCVRASIEEIDRARIVRYALCS